MKKNSKSNMPSGRSIRQHYLAFTMSILILTVVIIAAVQLAVATVYFRNQNQEILEKFVNVVNAAVQRGDLGRDEETLGAIDLMAEIAGSNMAFADSDGQVVISSSKATLRPGDYLPEYVLQDIEENGFFKEISTLDGKMPNEYYLYAVKIFNPRSGNPGVIMAGVNATNFYLYMSEIAAFYMFSMIFVLIISILIAIYFTNRTVRPLEELGEAAKAFGEGDFSARVAVSGDNEIAQLAIIFNEIVSLYAANEANNRNFMGDLAHELRTPMTSIKGFVDAILDGAIPPEKVEHYLRIVSGEVGRLSKLTQNMLNVSKIESGDYEFQRSDFNIWEIIANVADVNEPRIKEKNIQLEFGGTEDEVKVSADSSMINQVLYNLLDNAIKFTPEGKAITINVQEGKNFCTVSVHNQGEGIGLDEQKKIFQRLYKSDKSRGMNKNGSGLGLHICKVFINLMGGHIWVESNNESYTEFIFTLPSSSKEKGRQSPK